MMFLIKYTYYINSDIYELLCIPHNITKELFLREQGDIAKDLIGV